MSFQNIAASILIVAVVAIAAYRLDDGRGNRTSSDISVKSASD